MVEGNNTSATNTGIINNPTGQRLNLETVGKRLSNDSLSKCNEPPITSSLHNNGLNKINGDFYMLSFLSRAHF